MKATLAGMCLLIIAAPGGFAQQERRWLPARTHSEAEEEILKLSREKWLWMAERRVDALDALFHPEAVFVHMGATMTRSQELDVIRSGGIQYRQAEIFEASARIVGDTAIVLNRIRLTAAVGGNEVVNPFMVTETYVRQSGAWKLAALSFTRLMEPPGASNQGGAPAGRPAQGGARTPSTAGQRVMGDMAPKLAELTDRVLYDDVWARPQLSPRDRSLATVAALIAMNRPDQLRSHLRIARQNGLTQEELIEAITHLAFYAGWPSAVTAVGVAREVFAQGQPR